MKYDVNFFLDYFRSIPEPLWRKGEIGTGDAHCVLGHCHVERDYKDTPMSSALGGLFQYLFPEWRRVDFAFGWSAPLDTVDLIYAVNDGLCDEFKKYGTSPKERVINVLLAIKEKQEMEEAVEQVQMIINTQIPLYETA